MYYEVLHTAAVHMYSHSENVPVTVRCEVGGVDCRGESQTKPLSTQSLILFFVRKRVPGASRGCPSCSYPPVLVVGLVHRWMGEVSFRLVSFLTDFV